MGCFPANAEFEIITNAIYAAADQPRPLPVADDKPPTRTHFVYRIDIWSDDGRHILEHLAGLENLIVARSAYRASLVRIAFAAETTKSWLVSLARSVRPTERSARPLARLSLTISITNPRTGGAWSNIQSSTSAKGSEHQSKAQCHPVEWRELRKTVSLRVTRCACTTKTGNSLWSSSTWWRLKRDMKGAYRDL
jgi:hypothetical protein